MITISMLAGPALGAVIGYCTNYIAVKMLFCPLHPVYIGKWRVPFTPGMIPKGKERLAKAVGNAIGDVLLTKEDLEALLLSEDAQNLIKKQVHELYEKGAANQNTIKETAVTIFKPETVEHFMDKSTEVVSGILYEKVIKMNLGEVAGEKISEIIQQKVQGTLLAVMVNDKLLGTISQAITENLNQYLEEHGEELVQQKTQEEIQHLADKSISDTIACVPLSADDIEKVISSLYENIVTNYFGVMMKHIPISRIVEDKINSMDIKALEELTLSVMKKELNAIVSLGALIGFVIGCLNLLF